MLFLATPLAFSYDLAAPNPSNAMTRPVSSSVPSSGSVTTGYQTANAHAPIGARMYCQAKAKAHIHMIAGLDPATKIESCLAEEIINAYKLSNNSNAIAKKLEVERQADSSR